jgi:activating signal cointegrator 1
MTNDVHLLTFSSAATLCGLPYDAGLDCARLASAATCAACRNALPAEPIAVRPTAMKALTLYPTWAILVALEAKRYETRSWEARTYRGPLAITCSARISDDDRTFFDHESYFPVLKAAGFQRVTDLPLGCVVCTALLTQILPTAEIRGQLSAQELAFGNYADGRFAWRLEGVERLDPVIPCSGKQMLWDIDLALARRMAKEGKVFSSREPKEQKSEVRSQKSEEPDLFARR